MSGVLLGELVVLYQPVVDLRSGVVVAAEALVRLHDQDTGALLPPSDFLPRAEQSGRIRAIDRRVSQTAIAQLSRWRAAHPGRPLSIGINVSVRDLDDVTLPERIAALAARHRVPCNAIILEVTETLPSMPGQGHEEVLERLAALGCNVTLDDFGTGYSSLSHLQRFPVSGLKIDRSFTAELGRRDGNDRVARGLIGLGLGLGVHVVAEGVERPEQLRALQALGCPFGQGFLFSPAVPATELTALLDTVFAVGNRLVRQRQVV
ncbi:MAG: hypothetical protein JWM02_3169 [Frankiales bacterium]|nr:hypothetical protein [Frankiales bacterium]